MRYQTIPKNRIAVLIGTNGEVKESIEKTANVKLKIDSETGDVEIDDSNAEAIMSLKAEMVVRAIARGFSPQRAFRIWNDEIYFETINLKEYFGKKKNKIVNAKGRIIGENGKARKIIEELTGSYISVYGHTVSIIGTYEEIELARKSIEMLLQGSKHSTIYRFLKEKRAELAYKSLDYY